MHDFSSFPCHGFDLSCATHVLFLNDRVIGFPGVFFSLKAACSYWTFWYPASKKYHGV